MPLLSRIRLALCVVAVLAGLFFAVLADLPSPEPPVVSPPAGIVYSPGRIDGVAMVRSGGLVRVYASINGDQLPLSPDELMEGKQNEYGFDIPAGRTGVLTITAVGPGGATTTVTHQIVPR